MLLKGGMKEALLQLQKRLLHLPLPQLQKRLQHLPLLQNPKFSGTKKPPSRVVFFRLYETG